MRKELIIGGGLVFAYLVFRGYQGAKHLVEKDLNPTSTDNLAYRGTNAAWGAITANPDFDLGHAIYDGENWIRGLWGDSDQDRARLIEEQARDTYRQQQRINQQYNDLPEVF